MFKSTFDNSKNWFDKELPYEIIDEMYKPITEPFKKGEEASIKFKIPISKKRERIYKYKEPLDVVFMKAFCNSFNNHETTKRNIYYNETARYNYYGVNLQSGDGYGMCYIFPFII